MRMTRSTWAARLVLGTVVMLGPVSGSLLAADDLKVLSGPTAEKADEMMTLYLNGLSLAALDRRAAALAKVQTADEVKAWQQKERRFFEKQLGGWPERTPLNAQVTGQREFNDYRIEKVMFESRPNFHVTGVLYLPKTKPPYPAVLVPCGHAPEAKAYPPYQQISVLLARQGLAAFCFDPIGQGERFQILDSAGKPVLGGTGEHTQVAAGSILLGINAASYFVWDGIRALDYLCSRDDIDPKRIGCTGQSGGGTQTAYLMALDDRIVCAAPACFITSLRRLLETIGPQDGEQDIHGAVEFGMDHADYLIMRAPKPTMLLTAKKDFFDIGGARATLQEAKRIYGILDAADRLDMTESDFEHSMNPVLRAADARWMSRWLLGKDEAVTEPECTVLKPEELRCSPEGQVLRMAGEKSVFQLNVELGDKLAIVRKAAWEKAGSEPSAKYRAVGRACQLAGMRLLSKLPEPEIATVGSVTRDGYRIDKLTIKPEAGIVLPALLFVPADGPKAEKETVLYLNGAGKAADAGMGGPIEQIVKQGHVVLTVDLRGSGETQPKAGDKYFTDSFGAGWRDVFRAYLLDKSFVGMRAEDTLVCARFLTTYRMTATPNRVRLVAIGEATIPGLHAAASLPNLFTAVELDGCLKSWMDVVRGPTTRNQLVNVVHGALEAYDLPDLEGALPAGKLKLVNPVDAAGKN